MQAISDFDDFNSNFNRKTTGFSLMNEMLKKEKEKIESEEYIFRTNCSELNLLENKKDEENLPNIKRTKDRV